MLVDKALSVRDASLKPGGRVSRMGGVCQNWINGSKSSKARHGADVQWDEEKGLLNQRKHGVSFDGAKTVFNDPRSITIADDEHSDEEDATSTWESCRVGG
jgi:hypothetical protein